MSRASKAPTGLPDGAVIEDLFVLPAPPKGYRWAVKIVEYDQRFDDHDFMTVEAKVCFSPQPIPKRRRIKK